MGYMHVGTCPHILLLGTFSGRSIRLHVARSCNLCTIPMYSRRERLTKAGSTEPYCPLSHSMKAPYSMTSLLNNCAALATAAWLSPWDPWAYIQHISSDTCMSNYANGFANGPMLTPHPIASSHRDPMYFPMRPPLLQPVAAPVKVTASAIDSK